MVDSVSSATNSPTPAKTVKIHIQKNKGITHALLSFVQSQNMEMSDGSISKDEWLTTLNKLKEIQSKRADDKKIYRGGEDTSNYKENFLVDEGDIEFTQEEMNELYQAMGVTISSKPVDKKADDKKTDDKKDKSTKVTEADCRTTDCDGVYYNEKNKTHYRKDSNGNMVEIKPNQDGAKITQFNKDGSHFERVTDKDGGYTTYKYGKNGKLYSRVSFTKDGNRSYSVSYNEKEQPVKDIIYKNGVIKGTITYTYSKNGKLTSDFYIGKTKNGDILNQTTTYDEYGNTVKIVEKVFDKNTKKYKYETYCTEVEDETGGKDANSTWTTKKMGKGYIRTIKDKNGKVHYQRCDDNNMNFYDCTADGKKLTKQEKHADEIKENYWSNFIFNK